MNKATPPTSCWKRAAQLPTQLSKLSRDAGMRVFDFFAGGGCFSTAASELEGVEAALGVDNWSVALSTYRRNHPGAAARGTTLVLTRRASSAH